MYDYHLEYLRWKKADLEDPDLTKELKSLKTKEDILHNFREELAFGTAGIRSKLGVGTKRLNIHVIRRATYGLAKYILSAFPNEPHKSVSISYDSRIKSRLFAEEAARVLVKYGIHVYIYKEVMPTPLCSWAVRYHKSQAGIMITASHNPKEYNGYKVYDKHGCQMTDAPAAIVYRYMKKVGYFDKAVRPNLTFNEGIKKKFITYIAKACLDQYYEYIDSLIINKSKLRFAKIVYTPLNGTGLVPVMHVLKDAGFRNIYVVKEQEKPDGTFPTCPQPNPENPSALTLMNKYLADLKYDMALATDPDCDRVALSVRTKRGQIRTFTGNEVGILLFDYIVRARMANQTLPRDPVAVKTIVSTNMIFEIARRFGIQIKEVLTGFKYIGDVIHNLEKEKQAKRFIFGFEESIGYLTGTKVRDKDAVNAAILLASMCDEYLKMGFTLDERMEGLYNLYGYSKTITDSYEFKAMDGMVRMKKIMEMFRKQYDFKTLEDLHAKLDCLTGIKMHADGYPEKYDLPKSDVLAFYFPNGNKVSIRPSGTEPKLKVYYYLVAKKKKDLPILEKKYRGFFDSKVKAFL
ncbi:MAG: phospho-sugar mutase [Bacilli bacterium]|nr:phospho-sugar mutase [Bacilli bacterium]